MEVFDLGLAIVWEYDDDFVEMIKSSVEEAGISTFVIGYHNIFEVLEKVSNRKLAFNFYLDRASDVDENFGMLGKILQRRKTIIFNPYKKVLHAIDKASMHLEFMSAGLDVPYSIIIPPHTEAENVFLSVEDLAILGRPFIIKPCNTTGGGIGVVTGAETLIEVLHERTSNSDDKYILQEKIYPAVLDNKRGWFRSFWAFGKPIPVWWDDQTHIYEILTPEEMTKYNLKKLLRVTSTIAGITELDFFSTEIVAATNHKLVAIDYVNDQCDMRIKSKHVDGVPDEVVKQIINNLTRTIIRLKKNVLKS